MSVPSRPKTFWPELILSIPLIRSKKLFPVSYFCLWEIPPESLASEINFLYHFKDSWGSEHLLIRSNFQVLYVLASISSVLSQMHHLTLRWWYNFKKEVFSWCLPLAHFSLWNGVIWPKFKAKLRKVRHKATSLRSNRYSLTMSEDLILGPSPSVTTYYLLIFFSFLREDRDQNESRR